MALRYQLGALVLLGEDSAPPGLIDESEATGYGEYHIFGLRADAFPMLDESGRKYLRVRRAVTLRHHRHGLMEVPAGYYKVIQHVEATAPLVEA